MANQNGGAYMSDEPKDTGVNNLRVVNWQGVNYELSRLDQSIRDVRDDVRHLDTRIGQLDQKIDTQVNALRSELSTHMNKMDNRLDKVEVLSEKIMGRLNIYGMLVTILLAVIGLIIALRL